MRISHVYDILAWKAARSRALGCLSAIAVAFLTGATASAQTSKTILNTNLFQPVGITISPLNHYIISDTFDNRIVDFNADTHAFSVLAGPNRAPFDAGAADGKGVDARFRNPQGVLAVGDTIVVADTGNHLIRQISASGEVTTLVGDVSLAHQADDFGGSPSNWGLVDGPAASARLNAPSGLAYDEAHQILYIADSGNRAIRALDMSSGAVSTVLRNGLQSPVGLALGPNGILFIADNATHCVKTWKPGDNTPVLLAGSGSSISPGYKDGAAATARFSAPAGLYYREATDELIVADSGNGVLRVVQGALSDSPRVDTFAKTDTAGFKTPIAVTRDQVGVYVVCDPGQNAIATVVTTILPRIPQPRIGYVVITLDPVSGTPIAHLAPVTDQTFDNLIGIMISGDASGQHHFTATSDGTVPPAPSTNSPTARNFADPTEPAPSDADLLATSINPAAKPSFVFQVRALTAPATGEERIPSQATEATFRFKCGTPQLDAQSVPGTLIFKCSTTNAVIYYTLDGSDPVKGDPNTFGPKRSNDSIPLVVGTATLVVKARAYMDERFIPSEIARAEFSPSNFTPNRISLGFEDGEASTRMLAAPGQRFYAPVTLSLLPNAHAYGLQFDLSVAPKSGPAVSDYNLGFDSALVEKLPGLTNRTIPPAMFALTGANFVTNYFLEISTNYTYSFTVTNFVSGSSQSQTNYVVLTNRLADFSQVITTNFVTNLNQQFPITTTNYITNSFQLVSEDTLTNLTLFVTTNYEYRSVSPGSTNVLTLDELLPDSSPVIVTNFISNLGRQFPIVATNYITNSFNLVGLATPSNTVTTVATNYAYIAASPAVTNYLNLTAPLPDSVPVIITNFISNLGQSFPVATTNYVTNAFNLVSAVAKTNTGGASRTNFLYEAVTASDTNYLFTDRILPDFVPVITTNVIANLGQQFTFLSTNLITNAFNLVSATYTTNSAADVQSTYVYEASTPTGTNFIFLDHLLPDFTPVIVTNLVENMNQQFPVATTNYIQNSFDLVSVSYATNVPVDIETNFLYLAVTQPDTNFVVLNAAVPDSAIILTTNFVNNVGQRYPVVTTNIVTNSFNLIAADYVTNVTTTVLTNFQYRAVTPGTTNQITLNQFLPDQVPVLVTNFVSNLGQQFPIAQTNYITNSFSLVSAQIVTNVTSDVSTSFLFQAISPKTTNYITLDSVLPDSTEIVTPIQIQNLGRSFTVQTTNVVHNSFDLVSDAVPRITTNYQYTFFPEATNLTNYYLSPFPLADGGAVRSTNQVQITFTNLAVVVTNVVVTNLVDNSTDLVSTNGGYLYRFELAFGSPITVNNLVSGVPRFEVVTDIILTQVSPVLTDPIGYTIPPGTPALAVATFTNELSPSQIFTNYVTNTVALYRIISAAKTNYLTLSTNLPDVVPIISSGTVTNLGQSFPVSITNWVTNVFDFVSTALVTNQTVTVQTNVVYELRSPSVTNYLDFASKLPDSAPVVSTSFITNLNQTFPVAVTNFIPNSFDLVNVALLTNTSVSVLTNFTYEFHTPGTTNFISLATNLPSSVPEVTTNFISNLGQLFPVAVTNYLTNEFQLVSTTVRTNIGAPMLVTNVVYALVTPGSTNFITLSNSLPDVLPVLTTNFISNLGQLFPVTVTNYLTNAFRLVSSVSKTNLQQNVSTSAIYEFHAPIVTNFITLDTRLPDALAVVTTNFINNLGQVFPVAVTNYLTNSFRLVSSTPVTDAASFTTNYLYEFHTPGVTNFLNLAAKLPDAVSVVTTNLVPNLGQFFPVAVTNYLTNAFTLIGTNVNTTSLTQYQTNVVYELRTPAVTNFLSLAEKLPDVVPVITTSFITNLGQAFPITTTNYLTNSFELVSTDYLTNRVSDTTATYLYSFITSGSAGTVIPTVQTNFVTVTNRLADVMPIVVTTDFVTNLTQVFPIFATNYVTNSFQLVATTYSTNTSQVSLTNVDNVFTGLVITNTAENLLEVAWIERFGQTNLYNTRAQDLIAYSQPHDNLFLAAQGESVAGAFSFLVPPNAAVGDSYTVRISRPSATADGVAQDMFIQAPDEQNVQSKVKAVRPLIVTNQLSYIAGDVSDFRWFNAGEFGDTNILNNDLTELQQVIVYGFNTPPDDSDYFDAMDTCCYTQDGRDLSAMEYATATNIDINLIAFGDGSRPPPLGNRPHGSLQVNDLFVALRRSLDPTLYWYERYWSNGVRNARIVPNTFRGEQTDLSAQSTLKASSVSVPEAQSSAAPSLTLLAGAVSGMPGQVVSVPILAHVTGPYPLRTLMFNVRVEAADGTVIPGTSLSFNGGALGQPTPGFLGTEQDRAGAAWLNNNVAGVLGDAIVAQAVFTIPANAQPDSIFYVRLDRVSGSPNGLSLFPVESGTGVIAMSNRPASSWNDGIPDAWRSQYFGSVTDPRSAADADPDGDGLTNAQEYKLGTSPLDANDSLKLRAAIGATHDVKLRFHTAAGKTYIIEGSQTLLPGSWTTIQSDVLGTGADLDLPADMSSAQYYYRIRLQE